MCEIETTEARMKLTAIQITHELKKQLKSEAKKRRMTLSGLLETIVESALNDGFFMPENMLARNKQTTEEK
jgi:predicted DNA-binding protein